nr:Tas retrotransposon peptidase A16 superfamily [Haemonchus contortus]
MGSRTAQLSGEDLAFIDHHQISLSKLNWESPSKPQILVGCDQLWAFLDTPQPRFQLPSGLQLIPSKLGYLLTGRQGNSSDLNQSDTTYLEDVSVNTLTNFDEELERWDKYWIMDSAGVCEFTGSKNAEKEATNKQVDEFFEATIQKRSDGYYVRLPYKENHPPLPTNKAIALKRLNSTIESLKKAPSLLQENDRTFKEQEEKGIIEAVQVSPHTKGTVLHYIPHQAVITPHKETTELRIVFDASAHFKDNPSSNDVLHQGPLILPDLYAVLIRFRIPKYVVIADVEKAFLQVRLHEEDRDAIRFLWVKELDKPASESNVKVFRFTRVTFGLNVSPFLLAGTIRHHLTHEVENKALAKEIQDNLYVDNLILSAEKKEQTVFKSQEARRIFAVMGMNLREFLSN